MDNIEYGIDDLPGKDSVYIFLAKQEQNLGVLSAETLNFKICHV